MFYQDILDAVDVEKGKHVRITLPDSIALELPEYVCEKLIEFYNELYEHHSLEVCSGGHGVPYVICRKV